MDVLQMPVKHVQARLQQEQSARTGRGQGHQYVDMPKLGVPRDIRAKAIETGNRDVIWEWYDQHVVETDQTNLHRFLNRVEHPIPMMCVEIIPTSATVIDCRWRWSNGNSRVRSLNSPSEYSIETKKALIGPTYPVPAKKGVEVSCAAAITDTGEWLAFPVPYRRLNADQQFSKYQWIEVDVTKASDPDRKDDRSSHTSRRWSIELDVLKIVNGWQARKEMILPLKAAEHGPLRQPGKMNTAALRSVFSSLLRSRN